MQKRKKEKKKGEKENSNKNKTKNTHTNGHGKHREKKRKTGGITIELPTNTPALSKKQNKCKAKKSMKTTERKVKAER